MKYKYSIGLLLVVFSSSFISCTQKQLKNASMPSVTGAAGEMLIVTDKAVWQSSLGDTIRSVFSSPLPIALSDEPYFTLSQISSDKFSSAINRHRNILLITINPNKKQGIVFKDDAWAAPQIVCSLNAVSADSATQMLIREGVYIRDKFAYKETDRWIKIIERTSNPKIISELKGKHKYWVSTPKGYKLDVNKEHFFWISSENHDIIVGIISWDYPYTSPKQLTLENLIKKRNEMVKLNVPGPIEKSYMVTETVLPPISRETVYKGRYFMQIEGLWKLEGAFMGGPFISYTTVDDVNKRIITVEGFLHAPRNDKRNTLRQMSAILYTLDMEKK